MSLPTAGGRIVARYLGVWMASCVALVGLVGTAVALPLQKAKPISLLGVFPAGERYISAMVAGGGERVYCASSGRAGHVFVVDAKELKVMEFIDEIPGPISVHGCLALASDGTVYAATMCDEAQLEERQKEGMPFDGGHIYRYLATAGGHVRQDLGVPVPGEGIYGMLLDEGRGLVFGISYPSGKFFVFDLKEGQTTGVEDVSGPLNSFETRMAICKALGQDKAGNVYFSGKEGHICRYRPEEKALEVLPAQLPAVLGRYSYQSIDVLLRAPDGTFYGGDSDGYLFRFIPETGELENLGKVLRQHQIQGMVWVGGEAAPGGRIYGIAGEYDQMPRTFAYDPQRRVFHLGNLPTFLDYRPEAPGAVGIFTEPVGCMVVTDSGAVVAGKFSPIGDLLVWEEPEG